MFILHQFNLNALSYGGMMAFVDAAVLSTLKAFQLGWLQSRSIIAVAMLVYSFQPIIFLKGLTNSSLTVMNLLWDVMSDVIVTAVGLFYFSEKLTKLKKMGVLLSFLSIILLTWKDGEE